MIRDLSVKEQLSHVKYELAYMQDIARTASGLRQESEGLAALCHLFARTLEEMTDMLEDVIVELKNTYELVPDETFVPPEGGCKICSK